MTVFFNSNKRKFSTITLVALLIQLFYPTTTFALTGGPSQIEYENFEPAGATEMVNLATGDFVYNIPLLDVDGYPINISYHGGVGMEQESGWVGLGWSLNPGAISRGLRGLPDDFNGGANDKVTEEINIRPNESWGAKVGGGGEVTGFDAATVGVSNYYGITYNNYKGLGLEFELGFSGSISAGNLSASGNLGVNISSQDGVDFTMSGGLGVQASVSYQGTGVAGSIGINRSSSYNSRRGMVADIISGSAGISGSVYGASYGQTTGSAINLIPNTAYVPNLQYSTTFSGISGEIKVGGEVFWCNVNGVIRAYHFKQGLESNSYSKNAYGYLNLENADLNSSLDFNRDNDGVYYTENPKLPFATLTYDLFSANAQGLNELFRPYRNDFGAVYDNHTTGGGTASDVGLEVNIANYAEAGANVYSTTSNSSSGIWGGSNLAYLAGVKFKKENKLNGNNGRGVFEHAYFKALDELMIEDPTFYNSIKGSELAAFKLVGVGATGLLRNTIVGNNYSTVNYNGETKNTRQPRNTNMSFLSVAEASRYGLNKQITDYTANVFTTINSPGDDLSGFKILDENSYPKIDRDFGMQGVDHHISEITVLKEDGARYIYGLPLYNKTQKEAIFNVNSGDGNSGTSGLTSYTPNSDNSTNNGLGKDHFYLGRTLPAYAHSYLLTALVSKDYVDIGNDGLTNDDYGDYTKFNYSRNNSAYRWRTPTSINANEAKYHPASFCEPEDDKGMYVYGEREQWYTHSIETKNYIAEFFTSPKKDGLGVTDENGGVLNSMTQMQLDKIVLYAKTDLNTPIKTVNFKYNYSLCKGTSNSKDAQKGKLTLEKIYFTYGKSDKGIFSPYTFVYADINHDGTQDANPNYSHLDMDRWGVYKPNSGSDIKSNLNNESFPYTNQDSIPANTYAAAWNLSTIYTPAGSKIDITYESDDYSSIQDQNPSQMLILNGFSSSASHNPSDFIDVLYSTFSPYAPKNYMMIDLSRLKGGGIVASNITEASNIFFHNMLPQSDQIYFKGFVQIADGATTSEYIPGYSQFDRGACYVSTHATAISPIPGSTKFLYKNAVIKLKGVDIEDSKNYINNDCNPISKAGWQLARLQHPGLAYPGSEPGANGLEAVAGLFASLQEVFTFKEKNNRLREKGYSSSIKSSMSFVRLGVATKTKIGGGHRVSKIEINDNWNSMVSSEASTTYGQTYNYWLTNNIGEHFSSGVASYEPLAGGDEITMRKPIEYSVARIAAPDDAHFSEEPIGEAFFPQPTVIYGKITVRNLDRLDVNLDEITSNIGRTEYEFFTAKDFPIYSTMDGMQAHTYNPGPDGNLFSNYQETATYLSQGFYLRLNNMHGKLKSVLSYQEGNNAPISGTRYTYKTSSDVHVLDNTISTIDETGTIINSTLLGQHVEPVADFRQSNTTTFASSDNFNLNVSPLPIPPAIPIPIPSYFTGSSTEERKFGSATLSKVVTQQGILLKVESISNYASSTTENLLWDAKTGDVILSKTTTNYKNHDYSYETPAHWVYKGMGGAFQNLGLGFKDAVDPSTGLINTPPAFLQPGDEVRFIKTNASDNSIGEYSDRLWISANSAGNLILIDRKGDIINNSYPSGATNPFSGAAHHVLIVIKSGYENILGESAENISFSEDPRSGTTINKLNNVLDASAVEFSDDWQKYCPNFGNDITCKNINADLGLNPYILNMKGNWNENRTYGFLGKRLPKDATNQFNIRKDGTFEVYKPFYTYAPGSGTWKTVDDPTRSDYNVNSPFDKWILNSEITKISPEGNLLEAKDALNRYSASLFGYNKTYKTATAINSKYRDIGYDGFEDYSLVNWCTDNHFNFRGASVTNLSAHTGRYAVVVEPNTEKMVRSISQLSPGDCISAFGSNNVIPTPPSTGGGGNPGGGGSNGGGSQIPSNLVMRTSNVNCLCISDFSPASDNPNPQKYILSVWVKEQSLNKNANYTHALVNISWTGTPALTILPPKKSGIINGWQKLDYEFTIPPNAGTGQLAVRLVNAGATGNVLFDDIRIQPFNATMNTYVYDPVSLRLWAELDERNYATFYEYDNEGVLVRVKKETEKGIITIKETHNSLIKHQ